MARAALVQLFRSQKLLHTSSLFNPRHFQSGLKPCNLGTWTQCLIIKPSFPRKRHDDNFSSARLMSIQKRWASRAAASKVVQVTEDDSKISIGPPHEEEETGVVYHGPISATIKKVKLLSLSTCCLSVSLGPVITFLTAPEMNVILKGAVASSVIFLSASTTAALHWFVSPYVHKLRWKPGSDSFDVEMLSWLATHIPRTIRFADIRPPQTKRPFVTFEADGGYYFVDADHCSNKALLAKLTPPHKPAHESAFKNL